jgi:hypothetical protein
MKKHDGDSNTTLIFVRYTYCLGTRRLTWVSGRSVLCRHFCLHQPGPPSAPTGPSRGDRRSCSGPPFQDVQHHVRRQHSLSSSVDRPSLYYCPSPSHAVRQSSRFTLFRFPRDAREAMVESIRVDRHARDYHRTQPGSPTEIGWHQHLVLQPCDGVLASDAAICALAARLRPVSLPLAD